MAENKTVVEIDFNSHELRKFIELAEFAKELSGVFLRLGYLNSNNGVDICGELLELEQSTAWELGIEPHGEIATLLANFKKYLDKKRDEQLH
jgi:hypothetical protein